MTALRSEAGVVDLDVFGVQLRAALAASIREAWNGGWAAPTDDEEETE